MEVVEKIKLLGVKIRSNLKWSDNTDFLFQKAMNKMWILRNLKKVGASKNDLLDIYFKHCRSIVEYAVPVWNFGLTKSGIKKFERAQKIAMAIIEGKYTNYKSCLKKYNIFPLSERRKLICERFCDKLLKHDQFKKWFEPHTQENIRTTRNRKQNRMKNVPFKKYYFKNSPLPGLTDLVNNKTKFNK